MNRDPRDPIVAELGDIGDETWMAKTIKEIKVGDIIVITENSSAMFPNNHFMDMAKALGKEVISALARLQNQRVMVSGNALS